MELRHLRYLVVLAEELHFGRAAIRLNISQPPLSQQIRQLEKELGVQIFERTKRQVRLTDTGKRIVEEAHKVLARVDHFTKVASQAGGGEIGHLAVGVTGGVNQILVDTLRLIGRKYPGVHIELHYLSTGMQVEALRERRIDVGFLNLPLQEPTLVIEKIKSEPLRVALPKGHPLTRLQRIPLSALADQRIILFPRRVTPGLHDTITGMCRKAGFTLNVVHEVDSIVGGLTLVSADMGIAFGTPSVQALWPDIAFRPITPPASVEQAVAYNHDAASPVLDILLRAVRQVARKSGAGARSMR
ncbi:MAG TPA: LysR substrate-binding domain-containing protein [Terriglobia bacterium]|nr:LysR substrate-binding domain-containing protein [Terriglobia bacterium]